MGISVQADGEELEEAPIDAKLHANPQGIYYFIVDRSHSMGGEKMDITKAALKLFMQSLPSGCKFQIISFGSKFEFLKGISFNK